MTGTRSRDRDRSASGRFLLRLPAELHATLREEAAAAGLSLNEFCVRKLASPTGDSATTDGAEAAVRWAAELFGRELLAVLAYGSWARGEAQRESDIDLLIVLDESVPITRALYRRWDERSLNVDGHEVEPHFVHPRGVDRTCTGLWAEAALDGIVLFERGRDVSRSLARVRREVMAGRIVRKTAHGQPYWVEVA